MIERKQYYVLDVAKFIAAIFVIIIHTAAFQSVNGAINYGMRNIVTVVAVPFFFTTSGFLFFSKVQSLSSEDSHRYFLKYIMRLVTIYLFWSAVYFVFVLAQWIREGVTPFDILQYLKRFFFEGSYSTIWFLPALITAVSLVFWLNQKVGVRWTFFIAIPFYIIGCLGSSYYGLSEKIPVLKDFFGLYYSFFDTVKNGVLFGFVYVALGAWCSSVEVKKKPVFYLIMTGVLYVLMATEAFLQTLTHICTRGVDTKLVLLPLTFFLFALVLSIRLPSNKRYGALRKMSLMMFLSQRIFLTIFEWFLYDTVFVKNTLVFFISILSLTMGFSWLFIEVSKKLSILKKFY